MTDILNLPDWRCIDKRQDALGTELHVEYTIDPDFCLKCGVVGNLYKHGTTSTTYLDCPMYGKPSRLVAKVRRYKCRDCSGTFLQPLGSIDAARRMTVRALEYIQQQSLRDTFQRVCEHLGCDEKTVRNVANEYIEVKDDGYKPYLPEWIGLDETHLNKVMRAIITDVAARKPVDMLPDRDKQTLRRWFGQFRDRSHVKGLAIDMWAPYRDIARELFPNLPVVIDKFHVVKMANSSVERARIRLGKAQGQKVNLAWKRSKALIRMRHRDLGEKQRFNLDMWLDNEPDMAAAYRLKERLFNIYDKPKAEAIADYDSFAGDVPDSLKADFHELTRAMKNWRKEILNYFDHPITNAYTESLNGVAKVANRMGRGYSFEVIRARILFNDRKPSARQLRAQRAAAAPVVDEPMTRCAYCEGLFYKNELDGLTLDHFLPKDTSRKFDMLNLVVACHSCNSRFHTANGL
ncbi:ISL3 family transposase [Massilia alkalitolerans]|uniref:ISL3 family transposase n=1 Tax=Massilia alkalitolerans TaxID=286638 RepID=UPI00040AD3ED|nr:ISL3 family transposase [Massilia alkalitolerans]